MWNNRLRVRWGGTDETLRAAERGSHSGSRGSDCKRGPSRDADLPRQPRAHAAPPLRHLLWSNGACRVSPAQSARENDRVRQNRPSRIAGPILVVVAGVALLIAVFLPWVDDYDGMRTGWRIYELQNERVIDNSPFSVDHYHDCFCTVYTGLTFVVVGGLFTVGGLALSVAVARRILRRAARVLAGVLAVAALIAALFATANISTFTTPGTTPQYGAWLVLVASVLAIGGAARSWWLLRRPGGPAQTTLAAEHPAADR